MIVVGALVEYAANGVDPVDGGVAVWADGEFVYGIAEERLTRRKYQGGFRHALGSALEQLQLCYDDIDAPPWTPRTDLSDARRESFGT